MQLILSQLFGGGAYLAPVACGFFVYVLLRPEENEPVSTSKLIGVALLFLALLGLMELYRPHLGGWIGFGMATPLVYLFSTIATTIVLVALTLIGSFLVFDFGFHRPAWTKREKQDADEQEDEDTATSLSSMLAQAEKLPDPEPEIHDANAADSAEDEPRIKKGMGERLGLKKESEFLVSSFEGPYDPPPLSLLSKNKGRAKTGDAKANANTIKQTLKTFGIEVEMDEVEIGPTVTRYALKPAQGVKISRIVGLSQELQLALRASAIRIEAPIPGKSLVGIEVPNLEKATVGLASLLASPDYTDSPNPLMVALGKDITGAAHFANLARMPHGLIAGTTGSGKSVMIHNIIVSLLYRNSPEQLRFIMVDPKRVELSLYNGIPHLMSPVITDAKKALMALKWAVKEMERRYDILQAERVQNIDSYHKNVYRKAKQKWVADGSLEDERMSLPEPLPYIVIVMDELADLMHAYPRELEATIVRLAQMSRAVGIHLILATQRPSVNVITGTIKANIPTRLAFQVASQIDSRTIIDQVGAEKLLGKGDLLFMSNDSGKLQRLQSAFLSEDEVKGVVDYLKDQTIAHELDALDLEEHHEGNADSFFGASLEDEDEDDLYEEARQIVIEAGKASTSYLQRRLKVGYSRGARLIDMLEERGVIGPQEGSKPRAVLAHKDGDGESTTDQPDF